MSAAETPETDDGEPDEYDLPPLFETIIHQMISDDDGYRQNAKFQWWYEEVDDAKKEVIDQVLLHLSGWSYPTLLHMAKGEVKAETNRGTDEAPIWDEAWVLPDNPHLVALNAALADVEQNREKLIAIDDGATYRRARAAACRVFHEAITKEAVRGSSNDNG